MRELRHWRKLVWAETWMLLVIVSLLAVLIALGAYYDKFRFYTDASLIAVFAAIVAETVRRFRHIREDSKYLDSMRRDEGPPS